MNNTARAEWEPLRKVVIHRPGLEMFMGLMEPYGALYERVFSQAGARAEHRLLEEVLSYVFKVEVIQLKEAILQAATKRPEIRRALIELVREGLAYGGIPEDIQRAENEFEEGTRVLDEEHYFNMFLLNPAINIKTDTGSRNIHLSITDREPLSNLYFMRDQQFLTDKGLVLCRMAKPSRRRETELTKLLWSDIMGLDIFEIDDPGTIEGGEFIPFGDFALVGIGDRTNRAAIDQLLKFGLGYSEIGVVHQAPHPLIPGDKADPQVNMHLDTYFNVASSKVVVGSVPLLERARLEIWKNDGKGAFTKQEEDTNLMEYITGKGFDVINITTLEQLSYASNFLCISDGHIMAIEVERAAREVLENLKTTAEADPDRYGKLYDQARIDYKNLKAEGQFMPHKKEIYQHGIDAYPLVLNCLTGGYGGAHCMTCALNRG
ncbi:MAG: arginine deiminase family protein [Candidatus Auribacterota bacterium]|nr:arginine deiminase family protein [Candidatus Auribacterota bacterium]